MRPISHCLNEQLLTICQRVWQLEALNSKVKNYLLPPLADQCTVVSYNNNCLVINTNNASWATELRYRLPELRDNLRKQGFYKLSSIKIIMNEKSNLKHKPQRSSLTPPILSRVAQNALHEASKKCNYQPLKEALLRLAIGKRDDSEADKEID